MNQNIIDFNDIYQSLLPLSIKLSYLTFPEIIKLFNFPIKEKYEENNFHFFDKTWLEKNSQGICLVICYGGIIPTIKEQPVNKHIRESLVDYLSQINNLHFISIYSLNKKMAAVMSGLGQYGKNQLIYNPTFGFHTDIWLFYITNPVINLPLRNKPKYTYMDMCANCNECIKHCPAHALHGDDYPGWLDIEKCMSFYNYGDHEYIPSVKYIINQFVGNKISQEKLKNIQNENDFKQAFGFENRETAIYYNNKAYRIAFNTCHECRSKLPCSKISYDYNKNFYRIIEETEISNNIRYT